jgi:hypothetical protein
LGRGKKVKKREGKEEGRGERGEERGGGGINSNRDRIEGGNSC